MRNLMAMYHYVRDDSPMKAMSTGEFSAQVARLKAEHDIVPLSRIEAAGDRSTCVLTFDDGLKDSVSAILPILKRQGVTGTFFVPGAILRHPRILGVQKRHLLLAVLGSTALIRELNRRLPSELEIREDPACRADYLDDLATCCMKWMLDHLDAEIVDPILDDLFRAFVGDEERIFREIYLSREDLRLLLAEGMEVGVHGYSHARLGSLSFREQEREIRDGAAAIREVAGDGPLYMSYPSGSYSPLTLRLLRKYGYAGAVTIDKHRNTEATDPYQWGRYDCVDLPRG